MELPRPLKGRLDPMDPFIAELRRLRTDDLPNHLRETRKSRQIALIVIFREKYASYRLHDKHLDLGLPNNQEACVDPYPRGPDWMPITPKTGSLFHPSAIRPLQT